jgi:hypothetical protein
MSNIDLPINLFSPPSSPPPPPLPLQRSYKAICLKCSNICDTYNPDDRYKSYCYHCSGDKSTISIFLSPLVVQ